MITTFFLGLIFFIVILVLILFSVFMYSSLRAKVPFISVPTKTLNAIEKALDLKNDSIIYDLGCGDGKVLFYLYKNNPKSKYIGIENSLFPVYLARIRNWWHKKIKNSDIHIIKSDFYNVNLANATHIFTYLFSGVMDELLPKLEKELKPGTILVSASFCFSNKKEISVIDLKRSKYQLTKKIYVYEF